LDEVDQEHQHTGSKEADPRIDDIIVVSYPDNLCLEAKAFWQHTGFGISSRQATQWAQTGPFPLEALTDALKTRSLLGNNPSVQDAAETAKSSIRSLIATN
jgi:cystathionine gamma-synthase